jgi:DNA-nicking Smr family endonuclease
MRARSDKKRGKSRKKRAAASAKPVVFRLAGLGARPVSPPKPVRRDEHPMAELLPGVAPLEGAERVVRPAKRPPRRPSDREPQAEKVQFVLTRDPGGVHGHRADVRGRPSVPGRSAGWSPEVELDLHRARAGDVDARIALVVGECRRHRRTRILVIHGKGLHSARGESVLTEATIESLTNGRHARHVLAFATAPARLGGSGALAVDLVGD